MSQKCRHNTDVCQHYMITQKKLVHFHVNKLIPSISLLNAVNLLYFNKIVIIVIVILIITIITKLVQQQWLTKNIDLIRARAVEEPKMGFSRR